MSQKMKPVIKLIGYASGTAANNPDCALGPWYMFYHPSLFQQAGLNVDWDTMVTAASIDRGLEVMSLVKNKVLELGQAVLRLATQDEVFCVLGGDHSSAIGTWSAVAHAKRKDGDIGLIWIDAHMDSHTPHTSETQNIHGMPLAHLLGEGTKDLTHLFDKMPALKPENLYLIGVRSYEAGEEEILKKLGVKVVMMEELKIRGLKTVLDEACHYVSQSTCGYGISLDLDGIDPIDAPGVGCRVPDGISGRELVQALQETISRSQVLGLEIVEYNPLRDVDSKTVKLAVELLHAIYC